MSFFRKAWDGIKSFGSKVKEGVKWLGQKASDIYSKGKQFVESNPVVQKVWNALRNIEIPKLGISTGSLMDTIKGTAEAGHDAITGSRDITDAVGGIKRTLEASQPVFKGATGLSQRIGRMTGT